MVQTVPRFSARDEARYRAQFLPQDARQASIGMAFFMVLFVVSALNDYAFLGFSTRFYLLEAMRSAVVIFSIFFIIFIRRVKSHVNFDRIVIGWQFLGLLTVFLINLSRPPDYYMFVIADVIIVAMLYIVFRSQHGTTDCRIKSDNDRERRADALSARADRDDTSGINPDRYYYLSQNEKGSCFALPFSGILSIPLIKCLS